MKKIFLLIPVLALALVANAANVIDVNPGNNTIRSAISSASDGDVIVLADGTYTDDNYIELTKSVEIKAAEGAHPVIALVTYVKVQGGKHTILRDLSFDGSAQGSRDQYFRFNDNSDNELEIINCTFTGVKKNIFRCESGKKFSLLDVKNCTFTGSLSNVMKLESSLCGAAHFDGCEFSNTADIVIRGIKGSHLDECIVNDCYFHNNAQQSIYFEASETEGTETCDELTVTNSTFANTTALTNWISVIDIRPYSSTNTIKVTVNHCTFYNNPTVDDAHANIRTKDISDVTVSNSIFAHPEAYARRATYCTGGGNINNCLTYNFTSEGTKGHAYGCTVNAASVVADPLFVNTATGYAVKGDWTTMEISPARGAATDGTDLGDPRWYSAEVLPSTDLASAYAFIGAKAVVSDKMILDGDNYIASSASGGKAIWKITVTRACYVQVILNLLDSYSMGHRYEVTIFDAEGNSKGTATEGAWSNSTGDKTLSQVINLPEAGDYKIVLENNESGSTTTIKGITLSYVGGAVIPVSPSANTTLNVADALFTGCTRGAGYIQFPSSGTSSAWIKWNISTSATASYDITVNINTEYAHGFTVAVYEDESAAPVASVTEGSYINTKGDGLALELGKISLAGGKNYVVKVSNAPSGSQAKVLNLVFAPAVSSTINLPNSLPLTSAVTSSSMVGIDGDQMYFSPDPSHQNSKDQWAQWSVHVSEAASYLCSMDVTSTNEQSYKISILNGSNEEICVYEKNPGSGNKTLKQYFYLPIGDYTVRVTSTYSWSAGRLVSIEFTKPADVITLDENSDNADIITANKDQGAKNIQIIRTLKGGFFNTLCLPFPVSYDMVPEVFGAGVEIYTLETTELNEATLDLNFKHASDIWQGTPVLIKPVKDVVNPFFEGVEILVNDPASSTSSYTNFVGTFSPTTIEASPNNLFLGPNNTLYFPENNDQPIKGMRGWFVLHDAPAGIISRARIVAQNQIVTAVDLVNGTKLEKAQKVLVNGQLRIIVDGVEYNALGTRVK